MSWHEHNSNKTTQKRTYTFRTSDVTGLLLGILLTICGCFVAVCVMCWKLFVKILPYAIAFALGIWIYKEYLA